MAKTFNTIIDQIKISNEINDVQEALLSNVYTKKNLQNAGESQVSWSNITGKPSDGVSGDVTGPEESTLYQVAIFNSTDGKVITFSPVTISETGIINLPAGQTYNINGIPHTHTEFEPLISSKHTAFNKDFGIEGGTVCEGNDSRIHIHDNIYVLNGFGVDVNNQLLYYGDPVKAEQAELKAAGYEGYIQINVGGKLGGIYPRTAFNKDFGTIAGTVSQGNHLHTGIYEPIIQSKGTAFNRDFGTVAGTACEGNDTRLHTHTNINVLSLLSDNAGNLVYNGTVLASGTGDVSGPESSTINHVAVYADATGKLLKDGGALGPGATAAFGTVAGSLCEGNDTRLSDARAPLTHGNEAHSEIYLSADDVTFGLLSGNSLIGTGANQIAVGNHTHTADHVHLNLNTLSAIPVMASATTGQVLTKLSNGALGWQSTGTGSVTGPAVSGINHIAVYADVSGLILKDGGSLGNSAFLDIGTSTGTVATGDHTHDALHTHSNSTVLGNFGETDGNLTYRGLQITGVSGDVTLQNPAGVSGDIQINDNGLWGAVTPKTGFNKAVGTTSGTIAAGDDYRFHTHKNSTVIGALTDVNGYLAYNGSALINFDSAGDVSGPGGVTSPGHFAIWTDETGKKIHDGGLPGEGAFRNIGTVANSLCAGDDSRLSDARTPKMHGDECHSKNYLDVSDVTFDNLNANNAVGDRSNQVAFGNHTHSLLHGHSNWNTINAIPVMTTAVSGQVLAYNGSTLEWKDLSGTSGDVHGPDSVTVNAVALFSDDGGKHLKSGGLLGSAAWRDVGSGGNQVAAGNHDHNGVYEPKFTHNDAFNLDFGTVAGTVCEGNDSRIHVHENAAALAGLTDVAGNIAYNGVLLQQVGQGTGDVIGPAGSTLNHVALYADSTGKALKDGGTLGQAAWMSVGTTSDSVCVGNDYRLSNARTPVKHDNSYHSVEYATRSEINWYYLNENGSVGTGEHQVAVGNHTHASPIPATSSNTIGMVLGCTSSDQIGWMDTGTIGNVIGAASSVTGAMVLFANDSGKVLKQGGIPGEAAYRNIGSTSGTVCAGDDVRLSDARTPLAHTHAIATPSSTGFIPKLVNTTGKFLDSFGNWSYPTVGSVDIIDGGEITL